MEITDFFLAVFLLARDFGFVGVTITADDQEIFVFEAHQDLPRVVQDYHDDTALVSPKRFGESIMRLRRAIKQARAGN